MPDPSQMDPAAAQEAMASMFQNPDFMNMAQSLGQKIMEVRCGQHALAQVTAHLARALSLWQLLGWCAARSSDNECL